MVTYTKDMTNHSCDLNGDANSLLATMASGRAAGAQVVMVTAHPDDETIGMGGNMAHFLDLTLVQLSDGAPADEQRIQEAGCATRVEYAGKRRTELEDALSVCAPLLSRLVCYNYTDGALMNFIPTIVDRLEIDLVGAEAVFTHPYEGGHMDHDAAAFCVQTACANLVRKRCHAPSRFEFASYHSNGGMLRTGAFWTDASCDEITTELSPVMRRRREAGFACHQTQTNNLLAFGFGKERFRKAPIYDFGRPPPPRATLYGDHVSAELLARFQAASQRAGQETAAPGRQYASFPTGR